jgi:hypothetical protein
VRPRSIGGQVTAILLGLLMLAIGSDLRGIHRCDGRCAGNESSGAAHLRLCGGQGRV